MGKCMQSQQNPCKLDGPGKGKYKASQKLPWDWMVQGRESAKQVKNCPGIGWPREGKVQSESKIDLGLDGPGKSKCKVSQKLP